MTAVINAIQLTALVGSRSWRLLPAHASGLGYAHSSVASVGLPHTSERPLPGTIAICSWSGSNRSRPSAPSDQPQARRPRAVRSRSPSGAVAYVIEYVAANSSSTTASTRPARPFGYAAAAASSAQ